MLRLLITFAFGRFLSDQHGVSDRYGACGQFGICDQYGIEIMPDG